MGPVPTEAIHIVLSCKLRLSKLGLNVKRGPSVAITFKFLYIHLCNSDIGEGAKNIQSGGADQFHLIWRWGVWNNNTNIAGIFFLEGGSLCSIRFGVVGGLRSTKNWGGGTNMSLSLNQTLLKC